MKSTVGCASRRLASAQFEPESAGVPLPAVCTTTISIHRCSTSAGIIDDTTNTESNNHSSNTNLYQWYYSSEASIPNTKSTSLSWRSRHCNSLEKSSLTLWGSMTPTTTTSSKTMIPRCEVCERLQGWSTSSDETVATTRENVGSVREKEHVRDSRVDHATLQSLRTFDRRIVRRGVISRSASCVVRWYSRVEMLLGKRSSLVRWTRQEGQALAWTILFLLLLASPASSAGSHKELSDGSSKADGVCQSIDVRNSVRFFSRLQGCRIVEGFVQILLIDNAEPSQYANISFPELTEITGYLLLYRVNGLRSIGHLFPNLTVIRGHSLFTNYALVAFEMMNLQEIGLHSLTSIARGAVRFEKNPALCYVDTIDWDLIAKAGRDENVIAGNNPKNGCPVCEKNCPRRSTKREETLCWNQQYCQRRCESKCENNACDAEGTCCHHLCLGTCTGPTARDCAVCRDVITPENECKERCPDGSFEFMNRRCVSEQQCRQMAKPREAFNTKAFPYKPFNGSCVIECPPGYTEEDVNGKASCKKCEGPCSKECPGASVDSIASAQKLRGCTHITGSLEIQIRGGKNIVKELEENLSSIEEIDGYLKIVRSFSLISLNFLKNLRVIRGNDSENSKHTLTVLDNQNLQELWDWRWHPEIKILSKGGGAGKVFFHLNPKLCLYKIETLREKAGLSPFTDLEVSPNSNGDKVACNVTELRTRVSTKSPWGAVIEWEPFVHHDARSLLGYVVYFIEAPHENVTMYDGRDACGGDGWKVDDVTASTNISLFDSNQKARSSESHYLSLLKPYTQYAYYVKTYTIATERSGAQSKLTYFRTLPEAPSAPRSLSTWSNSSSELVISWFPPLNKNGNLTHYLISGRWEREDANFIDQRNYCDEPMLLPDKKALSAAQEEERKRAEEEKEQSTVSEGGSCECGSRETDRSMRENEVSSSIAFEDALHNQVYVKRKSARRKRQVREMTTMSTMAAVVAAARKAAAYNADQPIPDKIVNGTYEKFGRIVPSTNLSFVMRNLRHFSTYNIEVQACRAPEVNDTFDRCSSKSVRAFRTLPMESADNIPPDTFKLSVSGENNSIPTVTLRWDEPPEPNGLIVTYQIEYKKVDTQDSTVRCITRREFTKKGNAYHLIDIPPGNYTVKVRAGSLAGYGAYTQAKYFYIEERKTLSTSWVVFWSVFCFAVFVISFVACFFFCKQKLMRNVPNVTLIAEVNPEYVSMPYVLDEWEVPREKIQILTSLGNGSFGMVYEGVAKDIVKGKPEVRCAVKTVNKNATDRERIEFLNEASVMKGFDAHHVVKLLGVVTRGQPTLVIMELMVNGDLKKYLRTHRPGTCDSVTSIPPNLERILQMAIEIADGMAYLQTKKFVHRDLAARNCMVAEDLTVKIGDFGMTRDIYEKDYYRKSSKGLLPVRWMAPESLKDGEFSSYSDVWSYGVVLWEMVTFASQPYQGLSNDQVLRYVMDGGVMQRPENCPELLYKLMEYTWKHKASARPSFLEITRMLLDHVNVEPFKQVSFYHSTEGMEARKHLNLDIVHDLPEDDIDGEEESTLSPRSRLDPYTENSKSPSNCHDMNSSTVASKSGFFSGFLGTPRLSKNRGKPDYENRSLDELSYAEKRETEPLRQDFSSLDAVKSETLNNGYIGGTTT